MTVWVRIALYVIAGWLSGSGYISDEVKRLLTDDPTVAATVAHGISALMCLASIGWWRLARRMGWST
jgi:hypothetical protein